jgi:hypothetical protein
MAELPCLACPKRYWIAFVLESQGEGASRVETIPPLAAAGMDRFSFVPVSGSPADALPLSLVRHVVWLDTQGQAMNDVLIEYHACQDIQAHVNLVEELAYGKVLP